MPVSRTNGRSELSFLLCIENELRLVEEALYAALSSTVRTVDGTAKHILDAGGKRLRPSLVVLSAYASGGLPDLQRVVNVAAGAELLHMATLVHDDVIDDADSRRGRATANRHWGNQVSILTGDYMLARSFSLLARDGDARVMLAVSRATVAMAEGEIRQIESIGDTDAPPAQYFSTIRDKTAEFMSACCRMGAILAHAPAEAEAALAQYGLDLGMAFQITDDILDLVGDPARTGKPVGGDLREGKVTLPVILTLGRVGPRDRAALESIIRADEAPSEDVDFVRTLAEKTDSVEDAHNAAADYVRRAVAHLQVFPASDIRDSLEQLAHHVLRRDC